MAELDELKKLPPEERIKRLKELEEKKKKELDEAIDLIKQSEVEAEDKEKIRQEIPLDQLKAADMSALGSGEERQIFATKRFQEAKLTVTEDTEDEKKKEETSLEETVQVETPRLTPEQVAQHETYGQQLAQRMNVPQIQHELYDINKQADEQGYMSQQMQERKTGLIYAALEKDEQRAQGSYQPERESDQTLSKLISAYKR